MEFCSSEKRLEIMKLMRKWMNSESETTTACSFFICILILMQIPNIYLFDILYIHTHINVGGDSVEDIELEMEKVM